MNLLEGLNPQQREAVITTEGPLLILAGAGSGKTRVITYRIAYMLEERGVSPDSVLAVTFTNKAAQEMAERVEQLVGGFSLAKPWVSTFHSFCVRVLRRDIEALRIGNLGHTKDFAIYDETDQQQLAKAAIRRLGLDDKQLTPRNVLSRISWAKNHMLDPQEVYLQSGDPKTEQIAHVYEIYRQELRKANALDFDDLLLECVRLLKSSEKVRHYYQRRFQYVLVDEYQDTNRPQYELMKVLAGEHHNICAVGDEDQSIYSWRGADIRNILEFERDFPEAKIVRLEQNYRSTQPILQGASAVVANNVKRKGKNLWTDREGGSKIGYYEAPDGENEALFVADYINRYLDNQRREGNSKARVAVLYRTNSQSRLFEEGMRRYGLQYHVVGGFSFYERAEIKDMIAYLKLVQNPDDSIAFMRVVNTPARGIGKSSMEVVERVALETGSSLYGSMNRVIEGMLLPLRTVNALKNFKEIIEGGRAILGGTFQKWLGDAEDESPTEVEDRFDPPAEVAEGENISFDFGANVEEPEPAPSDEAKPAPEGEGPTASTAELLKFLLDRTGYIKALEEEDNPESLARIENLRELVNAAMDSKDRGETIQEFLDHAALVSDADQYDAKAQVTLMTLHAAKGLEFPLVFLVGMEEGLFPHSRTFLNPDDIEEERRLAYVGMTRAMDTLILSWARYRRRYGTDMPEASVPSRFLEEVPPDLIEDIGSPVGRRRDSYSERTSYASRSNGYDDGDRHYDYENEDQRPQYGKQYGGRSSSGGKTTGKPASTYNSIDNIAEFFASRGKKFSAPKIKMEEPTGKRGFRPGQRVRHPKYGEGTVFQREGDGEDAKITVKFPSGLKKLVEKYAQLERV
ncbi:MAG TPA: UvrD-helicase domain-containing protein [Terriglobales bacterium]|nr:UvrD-helicase domain-containing protein [Terriglobales bacterium]